LTFDIKFSIKSIKDIRLILFQISRPDPKGFTLLELIIVLFLITLILGLSTIFFANILPSNRFNATIRNISATIRQARTLSQTLGKEQTITIDLDSKKYGIEGRGVKDIPSDIYIKVIDPLSGEIHSGEYQLVFHTIGGVEGGTIVLWNNKKTVSIRMDPVVGSVVVK
jgi:general secretion pathway protein H